jgi:hypothetical protein
VHFVISFIQPTVELSKIAVFTAANFGDDEITVEFLA